MLAPKSDSCASLLVSNFILICGIAYWRHPAAVLSFLGYFSLDVGAISHICLQMLQNSTFAIFRCEIRALGNTGLCFCIGFISFSELFVRVGVKNHF